MRIRGILKGVLGVVLDTSIPGAIAPDAVTAYALLELTSAIDAAKTTPNTPFNIPLILIIINSSIP